MSNRWYSIRTPQARGNTPRAEVWIYGDIGESWSDETVTAREFVQDFHAIQADEITVRINSVGGSVPDGLAIHNAIKRHPADVTVAIDGVAMSVSSLIAMAGARIEMAENAMMMIHAPWTVAAGNAAAFRETADTLDKWAEAMSASYAAKTGKPTDEILALLTDGQDHYYTADEALAAGFVDSVVTAMPIAASAMIPASALARYQAAPETVTETPETAQTSQQAAAQPHQETPEMDETNTPQAAAQQQPAAPSAAEILAADKQRRADVRAKFQAFAKHDWCAGLRQECEDDLQCTPQGTAERILAKLAEGSEPVAAHRVVTIEDETDKRRDAVVASLLSRAALADKATQQVAQASGFRGLTLLDLARASLTRAGVRHDHMDKQEIVGAAFTTSTSDFPILLENTMHKALQQAYDTAPDTWSRFCGVGSVSDFRAHNRYRVGSLGNLRVVNELGEFTTESIPDGEKAQITASTKGYIVPLSRQMIINDDLGAFLGTSAAMGRAARRTIESDVYALLLLNGGLGPTMADSQPLFHANRANVNATGSAISVDGLDADRVVMASQTDVSGNDFLDLRPSVLLVPLSLGGKAREVVGAEYNDETNKQQRRPNVIRDIFDDIVDTPRLTGTRRYLFANPSVAPVIEVAFLDGNQTPFMEMEQGFTVDGTRYKVRLDYGVAAVDHRGAVTNAGT